MTLGVLGEILKVGKIGKYLVKNGLKCSVCGKLFAIRCVLLKIKL